MPDDLKSTKSEKIFVDADEEIVFIIEKIRKAFSKRILLIIPKNSALTSSVVNLKLLARALTNSNRLVILITNSELAHKKVADTHLLAFDKVEKVDENAWDQAKRFIVSLEDERRDIKHKLISQRQESKAEVNHASSDQPTAIVHAPSDEIWEEETFDNEESLDTVLKPKRLDPKVVTLGGFTVLAGGDISHHEEIITEHQSEKRTLKNNDNLEDEIEPTVGNTIDIEPETLENEPTEEYVDNELSFEDENNAEQFEDEIEQKIDSSGSLPEEFEDESDEILEPYPEVEALVSGDEGDDYEKQDLEDENGYLVSAYADPNKSSATKTRRTRKAVTMPVEVPKAKKSSFQRSNFARNFKMPSFGGGKKVDGIEKKSSSLNLKKYGKFAIFGIVAVGIYLLSSRALLKAEVIINTKEESISVTETISASPNINNIDFDNYIIPVKEIIISESSSSSALTTGEGQVGEFATGVVDVTNKTEAQINIPAGTVVTTLDGSNLQFKLIDQVSLAPRASELTFTTVENASIQATAIGDQFNVSSVDVKIGDYKTSTEVSGRIYRQVQGGSSENVKVVSEEDMNNLKNSLQESLVSSLRSKARARTTNTEVILDQTEQINEAAFEASHQIGDEADQFDITNLTLEYRVFAIDEEKINELTNTILSNNFGGQIDDLDESVQTTYNVIGNDEAGNISIEVAKTTTASPVVDEIEVFNAIKTMPADQAKTTIAENEKFESVEVNIKPFFVPNFLRSIPDNNEKVEIEVTN